MKLSVKKRRVATSELMGALIMIAITLVAGAAVFGWVNGQAGSSENAYGQSAAASANYLREHFSPVTNSFTGVGSGNACANGTPPNLQCTGASFWLYNNGQLGFTLSTIQIRNTTKIPASAANPNPLNILFYSACTVSSSTCGFVAYNKAGTSTICSNNAALPSLTGFYQNIGGTNTVPTVLAPSSLSSNAYQITMPTGATCSGGGAQYLYVGIGYTITLTGLYGNVVQFQVTVNG
ncbi:MAG TPA: archaellin/type IV pilin N-terminal domain-containing protein [Nitrososphaerales archaeon]|nr:archaellin/type IV pilin N-terminal domain-containing protein [Nitrososphaerales archaeon]